jgi:hypothetical protein
VVQNLQRPVVGKPAALVLDGVFARAGDGRLRFHRAPAPTAADVADVLATVVPWLRARLGRQGLDEEAGEAGDPVAEAAPGLAGLAEASVQGVLALGGLRGGGRNGWAARVVERRTAHPRQRRPTRRTRGGGASICTRESPCLATGRDSSACVGMPYARR